MEDQQANKDNRIRLLENWLPLAQTENACYEWKLNAAELEQLVWSALASLEQVASLLSAQAVLWRHHQQLQKERAWHG